MRAIQALGLFSDSPIMEGHQSWAACIAGLVNTSEDRATESIVNFLEDSGVSSGDVAYIVDTLGRLGLLSETEPVPAAPSTIDALCAQLEKELQYSANERDMVLLSHEFVASWPDGSESDITSTLVRCGSPGGYTAMAETVGIPCALGVEHILRGTVSGAGVIRPVDRALYEPLLTDLDKLGIKMVETERVRSSR